MAAGRDMNARLIIRLQDRFSAGLGSLQRRLEGITRSIQRIGAVAGLSVGLSFLGPIQQAAAFDQSLRDIAITAGATSANVSAEIRGMEAEFNRIAIATGQRATAVTEGAGILIAAGMERTLVSGVLPAIARAATGANASMADLSRTVFALSSNMRITPADMEDTLGSLMRLGMEGRFELRDMARHFSVLTANAEALRVSGRAGAISLGAMLQVALRGAGSADEAANNLSNFLGAITSPETVRNFATMGVNLQRVMQDATRQGINPIEAVIQKVRELTGGDDFLMSQLFGDRQVRNFLRPMIANVDEYLRLVREGTAANRTLIGQTQQAQIEGPFRQLEILFERVAQGGRRIGAALMPVVGEINSGLERLSAWAAGIDARFPGLVDGAIAWGGALLGVVAAVGGLLTVAGPWGLAAAALAGAGLLIYENWDSIVGVFRRIGDAWDRFTNSEQIQEAQRLLTGAATAIGNAWQGLTGFISRVFAPEIEAVRTLIGWIERLLALLPSLPSLPSVGRGEGSGPVAPQGQGLRRQGLGSGFYGPEQALPQGTFAATRGSVEVTIRAEPGTEVTQARTSTPEVRVTTPNRGAVLAVP